MITKKAGTILVNIEKKQVALIYRKDGNDFEFPKGHLEEGETLQECAIRETEEETGRKCHLVDDKEIDIIKYITAKGEDVELYFYLAIDDGPTEREIKEEDKEKWTFIDFDKVEESFQFENLKSLWDKVKIKAEALTKERRI